MGARRQAVIADYEIEIAALYNTVDETATLNIPPLLDWNAASILDFVRDVVHNVVSAPLGDEDNMFHHGCDSLQVTWIRNTLLRTLRDSAQLDTRGNTSNFVYDHPTIVRLSHFIFDVASGGAQEADSSVAFKAAAMRQMVEKYTQDFPTHSGKQEVPRPSEKVVLITGTTGQLGCYILSRLLEDESVVRVFALNRRSAQQADLGKRQALALANRGLDVGILDSHKLSLLEGDVSAPEFDLTGDFHQQMQESVTHIIHNAWPVDFNLALGSFEPNIKGLRNLIDFSLRSPFAESPTLLFTSSIGVLRNVTEKQPFPEILVEAEKAVGTGYQGSKWIAEEILTKAAQSTSAKTVIVRVGQLSGGINGAWNAHEWVPALVQSARLTKCIPDDPRDVSWIPVHRAAAAIVDFLEGIPAAQVLHLINPRPTAWSLLAKSIAADLDVQLVTYVDWLSRLEEARHNRENLRSFGALRLLGFFRSIGREIRDGEDAFGFSKLGMGHAFGASQTLRDVNFRLEDRDVASWMEYWRGIGLF